MKHIPSLVLLSCALVFTSCSMVCLGFSDAISPNADSDDETDGKIEILNLKASTTSSGTTLSWDDYSYGAGDNKKTISTYYILRSSISPWEGLSRLTGLYVNATGDRNTCIDGSITSAAKPVFYRIKFEYSVSTDDGTKKYMVLSEAVQAP